MERHHTQLDPASASQGPGSVETTVTEEWTAAIAGHPQHSKPAVGIEHVYVGGLDATVSALDLGTGNVDWEFERAGSLSDSSPTVSDGTVYIGSGGGILYALTEADGGVRWKHSAGSALTSSPTVTDDAVYVGTNDGRVLALRTATSSSEDRVAWEASVGAAVYSQPAVDSGTVAVTTSDGRVVMLDADNGDRRSMYDTGVDQMHSSPMVDDGVVYVAADSVYAIAAATGETTWEKSYSGHTTASPRLVDGTVYVGGAGGISAFDAATGTNNWTVETESPVETTPAVVGDGVVAAGRDGTVSTVDAETGSVSSTIAVGSAIRSLTSNGVAVYTWSADGRLRKFAVDERSDSWAVEPGHRSVPTNTFTLPESAIGPDWSLYLPDLQESFPGVDWQTLNRLYVPAGRYKFLLLGNLPDRSAENPLIITNKGGQVRVGGLDHYYLMSLNGGSNWVLTGRYDPTAETGVADYPGHGDGTFSDTAGRYGILIDDLGTPDWKEKSNNGLAVSGGATDFEVEFTEIRNVGFAGMNIKTDNNGSATMRNVHIHDNYVHDTHSEGMYIGSTGKQPQHTVEGLEVNNNRVLRTGTEGLQLNQLAGDNQVHHNVVGPAAIDWRDAFQNFQDKNHQITVRSGTTTIRENVILGGANQVFLLGLDVDEDGHAPDDRIELRDNYFSHCRDRIIFGDNRGDAPLEFAVRDNVFRGYSFEYDAVDPDANPKQAVMWVVSDNPVALENNRYDDIPELFVPRQGDNTTRTGNTRADVSPVAFRNAGFSPEFDYLRIEWWTDTAGRHPDDKPVTYDTGDIVMYEGTPYQCTDGPSSTGAVPPENPDIWTPLDLFPDDVRLTAVSPHHGIGLQRPPER
jgi:outer membrane protein assembly factor BamB